MNQFVFIDGALQDRDAIIASLPAATLYFVLDISQDGVAQIAAALSGHIDIDAIHIFSNGSAGALHLGNSYLTGSNLAGYADELATIGGALLETGDILLYGSNIGSDGQGTAFISALANATGADVAASSDVTGPAILGGNWRLEAKTGAIETPSLPSDGGLLDATATTTLDIAGQGGFPPGSIVGSPGDDSLDGTTNADQIFGLDGNDVLFGNDGDDLLDGGAGDDLLVGGTGNDTFVVRRGEGNDVIDANDWTGGQNTLILEGINPSEIRLEQRGPDQTYGSSTDLFIRILDTGETVTLMNYFGSAVSQPDLIRFADGTEWTPPMLWAQEIYRFGGAGDDSLYGYWASPNMIDGGEGNDNLNGGFRNDRLYGGNGNDILFGNDGDDLLDGGAGDDFMSGGAGNDTYIVRRGEGNDVIDAYDWTGGQKTLVLEGINPGEIRLEQRGPDQTYGSSTDLIIRILDTGETVTLMNYFGGPDYQPDLIRFADGSEWNAMTLQAQDIYLLGGAGDDYLNAFPGSPTVLAGGDGNDNLNGGFLNDRLYGGNGNDGLFGYEGDDLLDGGAGDDLLAGGPGNDTYIVRRGEGNDVIDLYDWTGGQKTLVLEGINPGEIRLEQRGPDQAYGGSSDLIIRILDTGETITLMNYFGSPDNQPDLIRFADGSAWDPMTLQAQEIHLLGGAGDDYLNAFPGSPTVLAGGDGNDNLNGGFLNDRLYGGTGNDGLFGYEGDDLLDGGTGDDLLVGGTGNDTYIVRRGEGNDVIDLYDWTGGQKTLVLEGINPGEIRLEQRGPDQTYGNSTDLIIRILDSGETVTLMNYFGGPDYQPDLIRFADGSAWDPMTLQAQDIYLFGGAGDDYLNAFPGSPTVLAGGDGNDNLNGGFFNDRLYGGNGNDGLFGYEGDDLLDGGAGDDLLVGGTGNDTYIVRRGEGNDVIDLYDWTGDQKTLVLEGINPGEIRLEQRGPDQPYGSSSDLFIRILDTGETVTLMNYFGSPDNQPDLIRFADGSAWDPMTLQAQPLYLFGGTGDDGLFGSSSPNVIAGGDGNDYLSGGIANDRLYGGTGNDGLFGYEGDDILDGGAGDDLLFGGTGNDTYIVRRGDGNDVIHFADWSGGQKTLVLEGINPGEIRFEQVGPDQPWGPSNLIIRILDTGETVTLMNYFGSPDNQPDLVRFADGTEWNAMTLQAQELYLFGGAGDDSLNGSPLNLNVITGGEGNDNLNGGVVSDRLYGGAGNDALFGNDGDDILDGGTGDDLLVGGAGNDIYIVRRGEGNDVIDAFDSTGGLKTLLLEGINPNEIRLERRGPDQPYGSASPDLIIRILDTGETVTLMNYVVNPDSQPDLIRFADGTEWDRMTLATQEHHLLGGSGDDYLIGFSASPNVITGEEGNDNLYGGFANDRLYGGAGNDALYGEGGDNVLDGGAGNDYLVGMLGNATYIVRRGDGNDLIDAFDYWAGGQQTLLLEGINPDEIRLERRSPDRTYGSTADLIIRILDTGETVAVMNYFADEKFQIDAIRFADGTTWDRLALQAQDLYLVGGAGDDILNGIDTSPNVIDGGDGNDALKGGFGSDRLFGGNGNDVLFGNAGDDVLDGGAGDDVLSGDTGNDTYVVRRGAGNDTIDAQTWFAGQKTLVLEGINASEIRLEQSNPGQDTMSNDLVIRILDTGDTVTLLSYFSGNSVDVIRFADGTEWDHTAALAQEIYSFGGAGDDTLYGVWTSPNVIDGGDGNDLITGGTLADVLNGGAGQDILFGNGGDDRLDGGDGNDNLVGGDGHEGIYGGSGNDSLRGAGGEDYLDGGVGNDLYHFAAGDANDTIIDAEGDDQLFFGSGVEASAVAGSRAGSLVTLRVSATDSIRFAETAPGQFAVETMRFVDGTTWHAADLRQLLNTAPEGGVAIDGNAAQNQTLAAVSTLSDVDGLGVVGFQWQASTDGSTWEAIDGADGSSLTLDEALVGRQVRVVASYTDGYGTVESVASAATGAIANVNDLPTGTVAVVGTSTENQTLDAVATLADADGLGVLGYQWQSSADGSNWSAIAGATASRLTLGEAQIGQQVRVVASYTDGHGTVESVASAATAPVAWDNDAPTLIGATGDLLLTEETAFIYAPINPFADPDARFGDTLSYVATLADGSALPDWLSFGGNADRLSFSGTPTTSAAGLLNVRVTATDLRGASVSDDFVLDIANHLTGTAGADSLTGDVLRDVIDGQGGDDTLRGGAGNDRLNGGAGADAMVGGLGDDTYVVDRNTDVVTEVLDEGIDTIESSVTLTLGANVENLTLTGSASNNGTGNGLDNVLTGNSGANRLTGGAGNDRLDGGTGGDTMTGGAGNDTYVVDSLADGVTEKTNDGVDTIESSITLTLGSNVENLTLTGSGTISGTGNSAANVLIGNGAANTLTGNAGADTLNGGAGNDSLVGGTGNDSYLFGRGYGADTVSENDATIGNVDLAQFGAGISIDQLWFRHVGNNLEASIIGTGDTLTIQNWYAGTANHVEQFKTAGGMTLLDSRVDNLVQAMAAFAPPAAGQTTLSPEAQAAIAPVIAANWQ